MRNDRPTPREQILNPIHEGPVEVSEIGTTHPVGHTGELRRTKEENRELKARVAELKDFIVTLGNCAQREMCGHCAEALDNILKTIKQ